MSRCFCISSIISRQLDGASENTEERPLRIGVAVCGVIARKGGDEEETAEEEDSVV
jgi:hypothetical protein